MPASWPQQSRSWASLGLAFGQLTFACVPCSGLAQGRSGQLLKFVAVFVRPASRFPSQSHFSVSDESWNRQPSHRSGFSSVARSRGACNNVVNRGGGVWFQAGHLAFQDAPQHGMQRIGGYVPRARTGSQPANR